jgi:hypothetical protein
MMFIAFFHVSSFHESPRLAGPAPWVIPGVLNDLKDGNGFVSLEDQPGSAIHDKGTISLGRKTFLHEVFFIRKGPGMRDMNPRPPHPSETQSEH